MLLAADPDPADLLTADSGCGQRLLCGGRQGLQPLGGVLLAATVLTLNQRVRCRTLAQYLAGLAVEDQRLGPWVPQSMPRNK